MLRKKIDESAGFGSLAPVVGLGDVTKRVVMAKSEPDQSFVDLPLAFEECHSQFIVMEAGAMNFHFIGSLGVEALGAVQVAAILRHLRGNRVAREEVQGNRRLLNQPRDLFRMRDGFVDLADFQGDSRHQHESQRPLRRNIQSVKTVVSRTRK